MNTRTDAELETLYKTGHGENHAAALRAVYQAGRADEQNPPQNESLFTRIEEDLGFKKRPIANLAPTPTGEIKRSIAGQGAGAATYDGSGSKTDQPPLQQAVSTVGTATSSEAFAPTAPSPGSALVTPHTNIANTPAPGTDPPGGAHPTANAG